MPTSNDSSHPEDSRLKVEDLQVYYFTNRGRVRAVDDISFEISGNESIGIVGESASGKSTLGAAIIRSINPPGKILKGKIYVDGKNVLDFSESNFNRNMRWKKIAVVFQGAMNSLDPVYRISEQLRELMQEHKIKGDHQQFIYQALTDVGLDKSVANRYPHELSGGMKQRVVIAMALLLQPHILIADEPTTALDVLVQGQIMNLLKKLKAERNMNIVMITHDISLISEIADKIAIMYAGQIVELASSSELLINPKHPYTQALIRAIPKIQDTYTKIESIKGNPPDLASELKGCRFYDRCPHAMEVCLQDPPLFKTKTGYVKCWLYKALDLEGTDN
ncbi:MAG: ABC transporter ATP-binding protein [Ignavibacteriales bacterium]